MSRRRIRNRRRRQQGSPWTWVLAVAGVLLILGGGYALSAGSGSQGAGSSSHLPSEGPIEAVHEMSPYRAPVQRVDPPPDIALSREWVDLGRIADEGIWEQRLVVQNQGLGDLVVSAFYTSCGCTTARLSTGIIPGGGSADLVVWFDAGFHEVEGEVLRTVIIESNDPDEPQVGFTIRADVIPS